MISRSKQFCVTCINNKISHYVIPWISHSILLRSKYFPGHIVFKHVPYKSVTLFCLSVCRRCSPTLWSCLGPSSHILLTSWGHWRLDNEQRGISRYVSDERYMLNYVVFCVIYRSHLVVSILPLNRTIRRENKTVSVTDSVSWWCYSATEQLNNTVAWFFL
jgi:hypothetical protein